MKDLKDFVQDLANEIMQRFSYELGDLLGKYPPELHVFCMAVMKTTAAAYETKLLDETDRKLLEVLIEHTTAVLLPESMDPRKERE